MYNCDIFRKNLHFFSAKRKSQQQTRQAYKWLKRMEDQEEKEGTAKDLLDDEGVCFMELLTLHFRSCF